MVLVEGSLKGDKQGIYTTKACPRYWSQHSVLPITILQISSDPPAHRLTYFYNQRQGENRDIMAMHPHDPDWLTACWVMKTALTQIIIEDRIRGPFHLCHLDLHFGNMLFDDEYNLTGVVDWGSAQAAPLEQLSVCPEVVIFPGLSDEENRPIVELKRLVVESLREMEGAHVKRPPLDKPEVNLTQNASLTPLSTYLATKSAEITYRQYMVSLRGSLWAGRIVAKLLYGESISWDQLKEVYGAMPLS